MTGFIKRFILIALIAVVSVTFISLLGSCATYYFGENIANCILLALSGIIVADLARKG